MTLERIKRNWQKNRAYTSASKVAIAGIFLLIAGLVVVFSVIIYWKIAPYQTVRFEGDPKIDTSKVYFPGDFVEIETAGFCNDGVATKIERKIGSVAGNLGLLPIEFYAPQQPICLTASTSAVQIPTETPPGKWQIIIETTYEPNPVRAITIKRSTAFFTVGVNPDATVADNAGRQAAGNSADPRTRK